MARQTKDQPYDQYQAEKTSVLIASAIVVVAVIAISLVIVGLTN